MSQTPRLDKRIEALEQELARLTARLDELEGRLPVLWFCCQLSNYEQDDLKDIARIFEEGAVVKASILRTQALLLQVQRIKEKACKRAPRA